jgi:hypothetical protein
MESIIVYQGQDFEPARYHLPRSSFAFAGYDKLIS